MRIERPCHEAPCGLPLVIANWAVNSASPSPPKRLLKSGAEGKSRGRAVRPTKLGRKLAATRVVAALRQPAEPEREALRGTLERPCAASDPQGTRARTVSAS